MNKEQKATLGISLTIISGLWFLFDLIWLPPGLWILAAFWPNGYPHFVEEYAWAIYEGEFLVSGTAAVVGVVLFYRNSK